MAHDRDEISVVQAAEGDLVHAARNGDRGAYGELYRRYARMVHGLVLARIGPEHVEDLVQDVFLRAMMRIKTLRQDAHFGGWIAAIARNRIVDLYRKISKVEFSDKMEEEVTIGETASTQTEASAVLSAIRSLPEAYRETLIYRLVEGMTGPEIAMRTGLRQESIRVNLHRGMKLLRMRLGSGQESGGKEG